MKKSDIVIGVAQLVDDDTRLGIISEVLAGGQPRQSLRLLRMGDAARETGLSRPTLWRAIRDGRLRAVEIRKGSRRIHEAELLRFVSGERKTA